MAAVSQATTTLLGGISQQPDPNKLPGQVRDAVNVQLNPTFGCEKRPASKYLASLASDIPADNIKWFDIFRDSVEKYIACIYRKDNTTYLRVWDAATGVERTVNMDTGSIEYLDSTDPTAFKHLTLNDYTLITNPEKNVTMNVADGEDQNDVALAVVNQIAYNTTYTINFLKDGEEAVPEKVYSASSLSVQPSTFTEFDEGGCSKAAIQQFVKDEGDKTGLTFELTTICQPTQYPVETPNNSYPTAADIVSGFEASANQWAMDRIGLPSNFGNGSYAYVTDVAYGNGFDAKCTLTVEFRSAGVVIDNDGDGAGSVKKEGYWTYSKTSVVAYDQDYDWEEGDEVSIDGIYFEITSIKTPDDTIQYEYKSVYRSSVKMKSGGTNWRKGDTTTVTMAGKEYTIRVETETYGYGFKSEASVSYTSPVGTDSGGTLDIGDIVGSLTTQINELGNYDAEPIGNVIHIERTDGRKFNVQAVGGSTEKAMYAIKGAVNDVSLLPVQGKDGTILLVRNSADSQSDDYYVRFTVSEGDIPGQGSWEETVKPGIATDMDPSSLPQALIREANGDFTLRPLAPSFDEVNCWAPRQVGDTETNPAPTFVGSGIANMFFFMNRLGFLSQDAVIMSQPGDYFNFFVGSAIAVSDADPIDMVAAGERPSFLKAAVGVPRGCLLFAENAQYVLSTQDVAFGPSTAKITKISDYAFTSDIEPLDTGVSLMFHTEAATYSKVFEMAIPNVDQSRPQVADITRIVPEYIPPNIAWSASNTNNNQVFFGTGNADVYNFSFFNVGNERSMSGWTKWTFCHQIRHMVYFQDRAYIVQYNPSSSTYILATMDVLDSPGSSTIVASGREFTPRLDLLISKDSLTLTSINEKETEVTIPANITPYLTNVGENMPITISFGDKGNATYYQTKNVVDNTFIIQTEDSIEDFNVGFLYPMKVELPSFYVLKATDADRNNVPMIETAQMYMYLSGRYEATLSRLGYADKLIDLEVKACDVYISDSNPINEVGVTEIPIFCRGDITNLKVESLSPLPASITGYGWKGHYNNRGIATLTK